MSFRKIDEVYETVINYKYDYMSEKDVERVEKIKFEKDKKWSVGLHCWVTRLKKTKRGSKVKLELFGQETQIKWISKF